MSVNEQLLEALKKIMNIAPSIPLGRIISHFASVDDICYITNESLLASLKRAISVCERVDPDYFTRFLGEPYRAGDVDFITDEDEYKDLFNLTPEKEQIAYNHYLDSIYHSFLITVTESMPFHDLLCKLDGFYNDTDDIDADLYKSYKVVNHVTNFGDLGFCKYLPFYIIYSKDGKQVFKQCTSTKSPNFRELFWDWMRESGDSDECFVLVLNEEGNCRARCYAAKALYGVALKKAEKEMEFFAPHEAVEIFHKKYMECTEMIYE